MMAPLVVVFNNNNYNRLQHLPAVHFWFRAHRLHTALPYPGVSGLFRRSYVVTEEVCGFTFTCEELQYFSVSFLNVHYTSD